MSRTRAGGDPEPMVIPIRGFRGEVPRDPAVSLRRPWKAALGGTPEFWHLPGMANFRRSGPIERRAIGIVPRCSLMAAISMSLVL